ncbi:MAG TPA: M20/M25/M40 family metallo-hydrolase [Candidatus Limnocylindria bacterium]|nr:M20/M25/M40 family metallo-hydrolase [Candidatus Limnocylindria bacterium]
MGTPLDEATDLLQQLIRNQCVNDGRPESGNEVRNARTLGAYLAGPGVDIQQYESRPGRGSMVTRIEGSDKNAPSLLLMGHIDVVPADPNGWSRDPFCGDLVNGEVWGRGALDMLSITATMAVAVKQLLREGWTPKGTLIFSGMADEEALGTWGAEWLVQNRWDDLKADAVLTESGEPPLPIPTKGGPKAVMVVGEKGSHWLGLKVKGTPGHGSAPYKTDNALVKAAEVVKRIAAYQSKRHLDGAWREFVDAMRFEEPLASGLLSEAAFDRTIAQLPVDLARGFDASVHTTFSPNILHSGQKTNIIPDSARMEIDIRTAPGDDGERVRAMLREAIGDLWEHVEIIDEDENPASASTTDAPIFEVMRRVTRTVLKGAEIVPALTVGATDSRFFRRKGVPAYGYSVYSSNIPFGEFMTMVHGRDERIDQESLQLMLDLYEQTAREYLG